MKIEKTKRGFHIINFLDSNNVKCSLQESSAAEDDYIWLGCDDANPRKLVPYEGWQPIKMPEDYLADTRMHLNRDKVAELLPCLIQFVMTGNLEWMPSSEFVRLPKNLRHVILKAQANSFVKENPDYPSEPTQLNTYP